jgi:ligand-binding SRPBCC domain-containing protein
MILHQLVREQQLNCSIEKAWAFFSSAKNLSVITPNDMKFTVVTELKEEEEEEIYEGMRIDYTISPILNIKMKWQTEIVQVDFQKNFIDFQNEGPYKMWHHHHIFIPNENGVLMKDIVDYEMPFGFLGELAHKLFIKKKLDHIFDYRHEVLEVMFNNHRKKE